MLAILPQLFVSGILIGGVHHGPYLLAGLLQVTASLVRQLAGLMGVASDHQLQLVVHPAGVTLGGQLGVGGDPLPLSLGPSQQLGHRGAGPLQLALTFFHQPGPLLFPLVNPKAGLPGGLVQHQLGLLAQVRIVTLSLVEVRLHFGLGARGQGLGLPLARQLIEAHGGTLELISEPGQGTAAIVELA